MKSEWDSYWLSRKKQFFLRPIRHLCNYLFTKKIKYKQNSWILEVGCGTGVTLSMLRKNYNTVGIDISKYAIKLTKKRQKNVCIANARNLPFKDKSFNFAFALGVLEHCSVEEIQKIVDEILRVSDDLMSTVPKRNGAIDMSSRLFKFFGWKWIFPDEKYYDKIFLINVLKKYTKKYELKIEILFFYSAWLITLKGRE